MPTALRTWFRFRLMRFPHWMRWSAVVLLVVGLAAGSYYQLKLRPQSRKQQRIAELWSDFDRTAKSGGDAELATILDELIALNPDDTLAARRRMALDSGSADESDAVMPLLTLPSHLRAGRWTEAAREARKRLTHEPNDWLARCTMAKAALLRGDRPSALREVEQLPNPNNIACRVTPASLLFAFDLFRELDRDPEVLREFVRDAIVDSARSSAAASFPVAVKVQLVECYLEGFEIKADRMQPNGLNRGVIAVGRLIDSSLDDSTCDATSIHKLGLCCNRLIPAFAQLRREGQITAEQYPTVAGEQERRTKRAWEALIARDPKVAPAYHGLALAALRSHDVPATWQHLTQGLERCGDDPQLLALYSLVLRADDQAAAALDRLVQAVENDPKNVALWLLIAETAESTGRRDVALEACTKARTLDPKNPWIIRTEAKIHIDAGGAHTHTGIQLLNVLLGDELTSDPQAARLYVRGLGEAGLESLVEEFLNRVEVSSRKQPSPHLIAEALRGISDSRFQPTLADLASSTARRLLDQFPYDLELQTVRALCLYRSAEQGEPRWNETKTSEALRAFEQLQSHAPENLEIAATLAWIRLKGKHEPGQARRDLARLTDAAEQGHPLTAWQWQVLGATRLANDQLDASIRALEKARRQTGTTAGVYIHLALAYHRQGKKESARTNLERARALPRTPQDQADYLDACAILQREKL